MAVAEPVQNEQAAPQDRFPPWSPVLALVVVFALYLGSQITGELVVSTYPVLQGWSLEATREWLLNSTVAQFAYILVAEVVTMVLLYLFIRSYGISFARLGLVRPQVRDIGLALLAVPVYVVGYLLFLSAIKALFPVIDIEQKQQVGFEAVKGNAELILTFVSLAILPPIVEEITMRGFLFTSLLKKSRFLVAAIITSIVFALAHLQVGSGAPLLWVAAIDTFILSMVLCYLRYKSGSLWPCIILHALKNSIAFASLFIFDLV